VRQTTSSRVLTLPIYFRFEVIPLWEYHSMPMQSVSTQPPSLNLKAEWDGITVEYGCLSAIGQFDFAMPKHAISVAFTPHDRVSWSVDGGTTQTTALPAGSVFIYSSRDFVWHQRSLDTR